MDKFRFSEILNRKPPTCCLFVTTTCNEYIKIHIFARCDHIIHVIFAYLLVFQTPETLKHRIFFTFEFIGTFGAHSTKWTFIRIDFYHLSQTFVHEIKVWWFVSVFSFSVSALFYFFNQPLLKYFVNAFLWIKRQNV